MIRSTRLLLTMVAVGLAAPAVANDGAPPVLTNNVLDVLTASTGVPSGKLGGSVFAAPLLAADAPALAQDGARDLFSWLGAPNGLGSEGTGMENGLPAGAPPSAAGEAASDVSAAAGSLMGGSISRSAGAHTPDSAAAASATASGSGLSAVGVAAQSAPGFSSSISRSAAFSAR
jgi:hypothetical protein